MAGLETVFPCVPTHFNPCSHKVRRRTRRFGVDDNSPLSDRSSYLFGYVELAMTQPKLSYYLWLIHDSQTVIVYLSKQSSCLTNHVSIPAVAVLFTDTQWRQRVSNIGGTTFPFPSPLLPSPSLRSPPYPLPLPPIGPLNPARGPGGVLLAPPVGSGAEPSRNRIQRILALKSGIWWQIFLMILVKKVNSLHSKDNMYYNGSQFIESWQHQ